ncbi:MAG: exo-alpha-sialidase [Verrucomicrobia bacterium]|nr:exo-alpha-sialidase [Verrucomicrobiota bacterium]
MGRPNFSGGRRAGHYLVLGFVLVAFGVGAGKVARRPPPAQFRPTGIAPAGQFAPADNVAAANGAHPLLRSDFVSHRKFVRNHAASLVEMRDGKIRVFWYAGTDEGTQDVTIQTAVFDPRAGRWSPERMVASRETTQRALFRYVKKLGNPVAGRASDGSLWLFYVTVSLGGWAGSSITAITSRDDGETWSQARRIVTAPFLNVSTLVKGPSFSYADGTMGLPVSEEFLGKFGELLRLDGSGTVIDKVRLSSGRSCLQPVAMIRDPNRALVLMRYAGAERPRRVISTATDSAGLNWTPPAKSPLSNSDAALAGLVLPDGRILVALNDSESGRQTLSLVVSSDGGASWKTACKVEDQSGAESQGLDDAHYSAAIERLARATNDAVTDAESYSKSVKQVMVSKQGYSFEFSYPSIIRTSRGDFHLVYTWNEAFIKHVQFSQAWLDQWLK